MSRGERMRRKINYRLIGIALIAILVTLFGVTGIYYQLFEKQVEKDLLVQRELNRLLKVWNSLTLKQGNSLHSL